MRFEPIADEEGKDRGRSVEVNIHRTRSISHKPTRTRGGLTFFPYFEMAALRISSSVFRLREGTPDARRHRQGREEPEEVSNRPAGSSPSSEQSQGSRLTRYYKNASEADGTSDVSQTCSPAKGGADVNLREATTGLTLL